MAKTVTQALVGILVGQGRLDVAAPAAVPAWHGAGDPRAAITLEHLLHMTSGLDNADGGGPDSFASAFRARTSARAALSRPGTSC